MNRGTTVKPPNSDRHWEQDFWSLLRGWSFLRGSFVNVIMCDKELGKIKLKIHSLIGACLVVVRKVS